VPVARSKTLVDKASPMELVGSFLSNMFQIFSREAPHSLPKRYRNDLSQFSSSHKAPLSPQHEEELLNVLHIALDFTHSELVGLILRIYGGPPEPFEALHCKSSTTEEDVKLFMKRVHRHPRQYLVLEVNRLPFQLQEVDVIVAHSVSISLSVNNLKYSSYSCIFIILVLKIGSAATLLRV